MLVYVPSLASSKNLPVQGGSTIIYEVWHSKWSYLLGASSESNLILLRPRTHGLVVRAVVVKQEGLGSNPTHSKFVFQPSGGRKKN